MTYNFLTKTNESQFSELMKSPEYSPHFLDDKHLEIPNYKGISVVVPTYNRCPYDPTSTDGYKNPLKWAVESILEQKAVNLQQIVIVDDASSDYTKKTVSQLEDFCKFKGVELTYINHPSNYGSQVSKNDGIKNSNQEFIFFADDDCIFTDYTLFGALKTYELLKAREGDIIGAVHIPFYNRTTRPVRTLSKSEMGKIDLKTGKATNNLKDFPLEYLPVPPLIDQELKIMEPLEVENLGGLFLSPKKYLVEMGGYPEYFTWKNGFTEEAEVSLGLRELGLRVFHSPDPKFHSVHLKYGAGGNLELVDDPNKFIDSRDVNVTSISLDEMIRESEKSRSNTGNRVNSEEYLRAKITSFAVLLGKRNQDAAKKWENHTYSTFVEKNDPDFSRSIGGATQYNKFERERIWQESIEAAHDLCKNLKIKDNNYSSVSRSSGVRGNLAASLLTLI
jgi:glycosyltransferase involved in cell wall biosynthesis